MKARNQSNALLMELLIVVLFFALAATVLLQVFVASSNQNRRAGAVSEALVAAQNAADRFCAAASGEDALRDAGFVPAGDSGWELNREDWRLSAALNAEDKNAGRMLYAEITAYQGENVLFALPAARYEEGQP
ncbi:MAG: type II secretion system protein [Clostridia bacterium]|nr:type II secretion system protein [Clostridia bacterium]